MDQRYITLSFDDLQRTVGYLLDVLREGVWDWNAGTGYVARSPGWYRMLGYDIDSFNKDVATWENLIHPDDYDRVMEHFEAYINGQSNAYCIEYRCKRANGRYLWIEDTGKIVERTPEGKVARMIGAHLDIHAAKKAQQELSRQNELLRHDNATLENLVKERTSELEQLNDKLNEQLEKLSHIANHDKLTSVYNRHMFEEMLQKELSRARRYSRPLSLIMVDADYFKEVNDRYGHQTGDAVLKAIASTLNEHIRSSDSVARWGGEEFVITLPDTERAQALHLAEELRLIIAETAFPEGVRLTCSFGVTSYKEEDTLQSLFARIDASLYRAKQFHRNNVQWA